MTRHTISEILAVIVLFSGSFGLLVDLFEELGSETALAVKWSLCWVIVRYLGIIAAMLLALDVFFL
jgi:hypothetical protein